MASRRTELDEWLPTLARYTGLLMTLVLTVALALGFTVVLPAFVPAAGLIAYKSVRGATSERSEG